MGLLRLLLLSVFLSHASTNAFAVECGEIPRWLKLRSVSFLVVKPIEKYVVKVNLPDLSSLKCESNALEYGTDYHFQLTGSSRVKLSYSPEGSEKVSRFVEMKGILTAHAELLAEERKKTPHYLAVVDPELETEYEIYLSQESGPAFARAKGSSQRYSILKYETADQ